MSSICIILCITRKPNEIKKRVFIKNFALFNPRNVHPVDWYRYGPSPSPTRVSVVSTGSVDPAGLQNCFEVGGGGGGRRGEHL